MMMGFGFLGLFLFSGVVLALLGGGAPLVTRMIGQGGGRAARRVSTAKSILDERYARGEIDSEEYDMIRAEIER